MAKTVSPLLPSTSELLRAFGERLRLARLRRRLTAKQVAERAGMTPMTLRGLERGGAGVTMGAYLAVMQALGIEREIDALAAADPLGRQLQDARLEPRSESKTGAEPASPARPRAPGHAPRDIRAALHHIARPVPMADAGGFTRARALAELIDAKGMSIKTSR